MEFRGYLAGENTQPPHIEFLEPITHVGTNTEKIEFREQRRLNPSLRLIERNPGPFQHFIGIESCLFHAVMMCSCYRTSKALAAHKTGKHTVYIYSRIHGGRIIATI